MSANTHRTWNRSIAIPAILITLVIVAMSLAGVFILKKIRQPQVGHRSPIVELTYCGGEQAELCVVAFSQELNGLMRVDFLIPYPDYPEFTLKIEHNGMESTYDCKTMEEAPESVYCIGSVQAPGAILEFKIISNDQHLLLARGEFSIIGIALVTPGNTPSPSPETPTASPGPSYPNPSYPNP